MMIKKKIKIKSSLRDISLNILEFKKELISKTVK